MSIFTRNREDVTTPVAESSPLADAGAQLVTLQKAVVLTDERMAALEAARAAEEATAGDALAAAVVAGLPAPSTPALDEIEAQLKRAGLQRRGLEWQLQDAERTWAKAQEQALREQAAAKADEQAALQTEASRLTAEVQRLQQKTFELNSRIQTLGTEHHQLMAQADELAAKYR